MSLDNIKRLAEQYGTTEDLEQKLVKSGGTIPVAKTLHQISGGKDVDLEKIAENELRLTSAENRQIVIAERKKYQNSLTQGIQKRYQEVVDYFSDEIGREYILDLLLSQGELNGVSGEVSKKHKTAKVASESIRDPNKMRESAQNYFAGVVERLGNQGHVGLAAIATFVYNKNPYLFIGEVRNELQKQINDYVELVGDSAPEILRRHYFASDGDGKKNLALQLGEGLLEVEELRERAKKETKKKKSA